MYKREGYSSGNKKSQKEKGKKIRRLAGAVLLLAGMGGLVLFGPPDLVRKTREQAVQSGAEAGTEDMGQAVEEELTAVQAEQKVSMIVVDPGHGGEDGGSERGGVLEKDVNLAIALALEERLLDMGYEVALAREGDSYRVKEDRVKMANEIQADVYVSIHQNTYKDRGVEGIEIWYDEQDTDRDSESLARLIHEETTRLTGAVRRGLKDGSGLHVTGKTKMPACLIETGFLSNADEREKLITREYQEKIAEGIARGIHQYLYTKTQEG